MDDFYLSPGARLEPGDILIEVPFPALRYPLEYFRPNLKNPKIADKFTPDDCKPKDCDTARGSFQLRVVMLLSHGCELDGVERDVTAKKTEMGRRYWLVAPVQRLSDLTSALMQERTRAGQQYNKFHLPAVNMLQNEESYVDLRKITPINAPYISTAKKIASLTKPATLALQAHIGLFFSGLVLYVQPIKCPTCATEIDPRTFLVPSSNEEEPD
jgi:hypothetical protein